MFCGDVLVAVPHPFADKWSTDASCYEARNSDLRVQPARRYHRQSADKRRRERTLGANPCQTALSVRARAARRNVHPGWGVAKSSMSSNCLTNGRAAFWLSVDKQQHPHLIRLGADRGKPESDGCPTSHPRRQNNLVIHYDRTFKNAVELFVVTAYVIGSSNLTRAAFDTNYEANILCSLSEADYRRARQWIDEIEAKCEVVCEDWLIRYKEATPYTI
jgi:hypothetical protein